MSTTIPIKRPSRTRRFFGGFFYVSFCAVTLALGAAIGWINQSPIFAAMVSDRIKQAIGIKPPPPEETFHSDEMTLLVLGCDEDRYYGGKQILNEQARSDMILLCKLDFKHNRVGGIAIPRDLWVNLPEDGDRDGHKINAYHAIGGKKLAEQAVEHVTGVEVDRTLVLNFKAFQEMVDLTGGIEVYIPKNMKYTDKAGGLYIDFKKGRQKLNGYDAMCFVRFRKSDSDFARMDRQRDFMLSFKSAVMGNPMVLPKVIEKASDMVGDGLSAPEITALSMFMQKVGNDNIKMGTLPVTEGRGTNLNLDEGKLNEALETYYLREKSSQTASLTSDGQVGR